MSTGCGNVLLSYLQILAGLTGNISTLSSAHSSSDDGSSDEDSGEDMDQCEDDTDQIQVKQTQHCWSV